MNKAKFTEGEWVVSDVKINGEHVDNTWGVSLNGFSICNAFSGPVLEMNGDSTQKANANLIAAAPEMYEMLECYSEYFKKQGSGDHVHIESMLAKARGEQ